MSNTLTLIGKPAPDFSAVAQHNETVHLADFQGKKHVILFFVKTYSCTPCRHHVRHLGKLYDKFLALDTEIVVILQGDKIDVQGFADVTDAPFPVLGDRGADIYDMFGLRESLNYTRPGSIIVDKDGKVRYARNAMYSWGWRGETDVLLEQLEEIQADKVA